jgi:hypothetical protein
VSAQAAGAELQKNTSVSARAVTNLDMFTPEVGVAIAQVPPVIIGKSHYYLIHTVDGGEAWRVLGSLPAMLTPAQLFLLVMAFSSPSEGYVAVLGSTHTGFTDNGGHTWSTVRIPGQPTAMSLNGNSLWVTASRCAAKSDNPSLCPTDLIDLTVGRLTPATVRAIPTKGPVLSGVVDSATFQATLWSRSGNEGLASEGGDGPASSILETVNAGISWSVVQNPCGKTTIGGLVQSGASHWFLYCSLDGGMHQGSNELWVTTNSGQNWALAAEGNESGQGPTIGNIGSVMLGGLTISRNGHVLWTLGSVQGIEYSTNGGGQWGGVPVETGGYPAQITTAGTTEAWLPLPGVGLYRTLNGTTWTRLH